jgi:hypothetical protein
MVVVVVVTVVVQVVVDSELTLASKLEASVRPPSLDGRESAVRKGRSRAVWVVPSLKLLSQSGLYYSIQA